MFPLLLSRFDFQLKYLGQLVEDVPPGAFSIQPVPGMNHPAWIVGHLAWACDSLVTLLGGEKSLDEAWSQTFNFRSKADPDPLRYPEKDVLWTALVLGHEKGAEAVRDADPAILERPLPLELFRPLLPTIGDAVVHLLTTHEATHLGQLSAWRRAMGFPPAKMMAMI